MHICVWQSSYIALSCKISLLYSQRTTKALIRLRGGAGWSAPLLFTYDKNRFSHDVAHFQINRSYLCRIRRKRVCCIKFYGEKQLLTYHSGGRHICRTCESVSENHGNFWTVQDSLMKYHKWDYRINLCLIDKNEKCCISSFLVMRP